MEEYIFTDQALITVMAASSIGTKKQVMRFDYFDCHIDNIWLHTPGKINIGIPIVDMTHYFSLVRSSS
jgi:hypothetical protein